MSHFHRALVDRVELVDIEPTKWMACKAVLGAIANHANEQEADLSWPGVELLMLETGASERVVVRTTTLLHAKGWIVKKRRSGTSNLYRLNVAKLKAHQVDRGTAQPVFMSKHLAGMALPGENLTALAATSKPKRSTSRQRAAQASDQPTRQIGVKEQACDQPTRQFGVLETPDWREEDANLACASRQIGDVIISEPSGNSHLSIDAREDGATDGRASAEDKPSPQACAEPPAWAIDLVREFDFGTNQKRPSRKQLRELAGLVAAARNVHGLSEAEIVRHCRLTIREATSNAVAYLRNGLLEHLPEPVPRTDPPADTPDLGCSTPKPVVPSDDLSAQEWISRGLPEHLLPTRLRSGARTTS